MTRPERDFLETAEAAARAAGAVLADWRSRFTVREKSRANLVTEADLAAQEAIHGLIHRRFPEHNFLGEEGLAETNSDGPYRWVIDPLDGTSNYVHGFPYYGVSIALESRLAAPQRGARGSLTRSDESELLVGVIFDPNRDELFAAVRGEGATLNGAPIRCSETATLGEAMVMGSLPTGVQRDHPAIRKFLDVMPHVQALQRTGSAALNLAAVACGRIDAFWSIS
ncbi:MAG: inositol monophosphatase family protein, partial [Planctomycetaceae bacterium]